MPPTASAINIKNPPVYEIPFSLTAVISKCYGSKIKDKTVTLFLFDCFLNDHFIESANNKWQLPCVTHFS